MSAIALLVGVLFLNGAAARNNLTVLPPMGWMSWELFRCNLATSTDDCSDPSTTRCVSEALYHGVADALVATGLASAGYAAVHLDDCWQAENRSSSNDLLWNACACLSGAICAQCHFVLMRRRPLVCSPISFRWPGSWRLLSCTRPLVCLVHQVHNSAMPWRRIFSPD